MGGLLRSWPSAWEGCLTVKGTSTDPSGAWTQAHTGIGEPGASTRALAPTHVSQCLASLPRWQEDRCHLRRFQKGVLQVQKPP